MNYNYKNLFNLLILSLILTLPYNLLATNYYVATTGDDVNLGTSSGAPKATIQDILDDYDLEPGDTIFIAAGTYNENDINSNAANDDNGFVFQGAGIDVTIIDGGGTNAVFEFGDGTGCTGGACRDIEFHDMTIQNGSGPGAAINMYWNPGADLYDVKIDNCDPGANGEAAVHFDDNTPSTSNTDHILTNVTIQNCNSSSGSGALHVQMFPDGVGVTGILNMTNCTIDNNSGGTQGTVYLETSYSGMHVYMTNCTFSNNSATRGGAIHTDESASGSGFDSMLVSKCTFYGNTATQGSAIYSDGEGDEYYENCLFYENEASGNKGGVINVAPNNTPKVILRNSTVADNTHSGANYGGIVMDQLFGGHFVAQNSIFYGNDNKDFYVNSWFGAFEVDYCVYGTIEDIDPTASITHSFTTNPNFVDASTDNYNIQNTGSAYNAGSATYAPADDINGLARPQDGVDDIGAYEYGTACTTPTSQPTTFATANLDSTSVDLSWADAGDGDRVLVVVKEGGAITDDPVDGTTYTASADWASKGDDLGSNSYVVYAGSGTSVSLSNLDYATTYYVEIFEYNDAGKCYYTTTPLAETFTTDSCYYYVDDNSNTDDKWTTGATGSDVAGDGSVGAPYASLAKVFSDHTVTKGVVIRLDYGTYNSSQENEINPDNSDEDFSIVGASRTGTIIDVPGTNRAFQLINNGSISMQGFTITGAAPSSSNGAGIYFSETGVDTLTLTNMVISSNIAYGTSNGGGVYIATSGGTSSLIATKCLFSGNEATNQGGGIHLQGGTSATYSFTKCTFTDNTSQHHGSAIHVYHGDMTITNCLVYENTINGVNAGDEGAIRSRGGNHTIWHLTLVDNIGGNEGGITLDISGSITMNNSIVWNNQGNDIDHDAGTFTLNNCIYEDDEGSPTYNSCLTSAPTFYDALNDNYDITGSSAGVDGGLTVGGPSDDINDKIRDANPDMGCYESGSNVPFCPTRVVWTGAVNNSWSETGNWDQGIVPCGNHVYINDVANDPTLDMKGECDSLQMNGGAVLTWNTSDSLIVEGDLDLNGTSIIAHNGDGVFFLEGTGKFVNADANIITTSLPPTVKGSYTLETDWNVDDINIVTGGSFTVNTGLTLTMEDDAINGGTLILGGTSIMEVKGNFANNGTFTANSSTTRFHGSLPQTISGSSEPSFYNLELDNNSGLTLLRSAITSNVYTITDGILTTTSANILKMDNGAMDNANPFSGGTSTDYIHGPVRIVDYTASVVYADSLKVPVGDGTTTYAPVWIIPAATSTNTWEIEYQAVSAQSISTSKCANTFKAVSENDHFRISRTGSGNAKIRFYWNAVSDIGPQGNLDDLYIAHYDSGTPCWEMLGSDALDYNRDWDDQYLETNFDVTEYSPFAFTSKDGLLNLPIELIYFKGQLEDGKVNLTWKTAVEEDNDFYIIEKKVDGQYEELTRVESKGNTIIGHNYETEDLNPSFGVTDYRLTQVDYDGKQSVSGIATVINNAAAMQVVIENKQLHFFSDEDLVADVEVVNVIGSKVASSNISSGSVMDLSHLTDGIYFLIFKDGVNQMSEKVYLK